MLELSDILSFSLGVQLCGELTVELVELVPLLILDEGTTAAESVDKPGVVVGEVDISDLQVFPAVGQLGELVLKDFLKPELDLVAVTFVVLEAVRVNVASHLVDLVLAQLDLEAVV